jgi:iron complex transport system substrate-binding protein
MSALRIVSFLPAATEMIYLLGLADRLVGRTHECDYPDEVKQKPIIVDCALDLGQMTMAQVDTAVSKQLASGKSLYKVDEAKLRAAAPNLLVTQNLCQVCGTDSVRMPWERVQSYLPEVILVSPCAFKTPKALELAALLGSKPGWNALPAPDAYAAVT